MFAAAAHSRRRGWMEDEAYVVVEVVLVFAAAIQWMHLVIGSCKIVIVVEDLLLVGWVDIIILFGLFLFFPKDFLIVVHKNNIVGRLQCPINRKIVQYINIQCMCAILDYAADALSPPPNHAWQVTIPIGDIDIITSLNHTAKCRNQHFWKRPFTRSRCTTKIYWFCWALAMHISIINTYYTFWIILTHRAAVEGVLVFAPASKSSWFLWRPQCWSDPPVTAKSITHIVVP